jgi:hypothetical protein
MGGVCECFDRGLEYFEFNPDFQTKALTVLSGFLTLQKGRKGLKVKNKK